MTKQALITVLYVDDNETNRYIVSRMLQNAGYQVLEANTGESGLQIVGEHQPDLIILDVKLPGLNGFEVCRCIKNDPATASIPVLHLSASFVDRHDRALGLNSGADAYLTQPVEAVELIATVRALLRIRRAEEIALALAREWQTTFDSMSDGVGLLDTQGRFRRCNRAIAEMLKISNEDLIDQDHQVVMQTQLRSSLTPFNQVRETCHRESLEIQVEGRCFAITVDPVLDEQQQFMGAVYILSDVTHRRRAEENLRFLVEASVLLSSSLDYEATLKNLANLVVPQFADWCVIDIVEPDGSLRRLEVHHRDPEQVALVWELARRYPNKPNRQKGITQVIRTKRPELVSHVSEELLREYAQDTEHLKILLRLQVCSYIIVPLLSNQRVLGTIALVTAESHRHYTQSDLALSEDLARRAAVAIDNARLYQDAQNANQMKDEFLATLSHELRSPLNAMLGWARLLNTRQYDPETTARALETIERNAKAQAQLVEDLLDVSRIIRGKMRLMMRPLDLAPVIETAINTVRPAAEAKGIQIQAVLDATSGKVAGDPDRLQQIVWNLMSNAIKFTPKGGQVQVRLERIRSHLEIIVSDTGQGIKPEFVPYVFERFRQADSSTTRSYAGLGLGLAIVRHLVELHGGSVHASSPGEDQGATFTVKLPLLPVVTPEPTAYPPYPTSETSASLDDGSPALNGVRVLVVDDEVDARAYLTAALEQCGAEVITASSVEEAIDLITHLHPDVLVSDIGMPSEDGYALIRKLRSRPPEQGGQIPAVALTAYARAEDRTRAIAAGFQIHIPKPVEPTELATVVASLAAREH